MVMTREEQLSLQRLEDVGMFFQGTAPVQLALRKITKVLDEAHIPYAVAGAMALNEHGHRRATIDVDILITRDGLQALKAHVLGRGWVEKFAGSKTLRDTEHDVTIDFLIAGDYPGDGKVKAVQFPDPTRLKVLRSFASFLPLATFIELKLASGMSAAHRGKDLVDVQELIKSARLPADLAEQLDPSVRVRYRELWALAQVAIKEEEEY